MIIRYKCNKTVSIKSRGELHGQDLIENSYIYKNFSLTILSQTEIRKRNYVCLLYTVINDINISKLIIGFRENKSI